MKFSTRWSRTPGLPSPAPDPAGSDPAANIAIDGADRGPAPSRWRERLGTGALIVLAAGLIFDIGYRFPVLPYLLLAIVISSLWRWRAGLVCLIASFGILTAAVLNESPRPWQDGFEDMLRMTLLGLVFMGARRVLDRMERQRRTERRLIAELSRTVEQLRESERQQALAAQALAGRNQELHAAQEQLLRAERLAALGQFSATMAHELRNPLNVVKLSARYITTQLTEPDEKLQRNLTHMNQYVDRACDIIGDLLAFSRLPPPQRRLVVVNDLVRDGVLAVAIPDTVTVEWALAADLPPVPADARQVEQAVTNLVQNALQAMAAGGRLTVSTVRLDDRVTISIADTGPGVPPELCERVFEPFFSTKASGTGLGLPLVREIALAHGGQFGLQSPPGGGACFTLSLPLQAAPTPETPHPPALLDGERPSSGPIAS